MVHRLALFALAALSVTGLAAPAWSQDAVAPCRLCDSASASTDDKPALPVRLDIETSLDFDRLILASSDGGSAGIAPDGSHSVSGSVGTMSARAMVGQVMIRGEPGRSVRISLPPSIQLDGLAGGSIRLDSIRSDLSAAPRLGSDGTLSFRFGGILRISGDVNGEFRGNVPIDVDYF